MTRSTLFAGSTLLLAAAGLSIPPAAAQGAASCSAEAPAAKPKKKLGLGGLIGAARGSGLIGSVAGAMRGDGNLKSDIVDRATGAGAAAAERALACAGSKAAPASDGEQAAADAAPAPRQPAAATFTYPSEIPDPEGFKALKDAYNAFGRVPCMECEGGHAFDGWPAFPRDEYSGKYNGNDQRIGSWPVGHVFHWQGIQSHGTLTVLGEQTVSGFRCRTLRYRLTKSGASAERPGLPCWGRANQFAGHESWNSVY